jgi:hypothetical protein
MITAASRFQAMASKGAKVANFCGDGIGTLAGQKLVSKGAK